MNTTPLTNQAFDLNPIAAIAAFARSLRRKAREFREKRATLKMLSKLDERNLRDLGLIQSDLSKSGTDPAKLGEPGRW